MGLVSLFCLQGFPVVLVSLEARGVQADQVAHMVLAAYWDPVGQAVLAAPEVLWGLVGLVGPVALVGLLYQGPDYQGSLVDRMDLAALMVLADQVDRVDRVVFLGQVGQMVLVARVDHLHLVFLVLQVGLVVQAALVALAALAALVALVALVALLLLVSRALLADQMALVAP